MVARGRICRGGLRSEGVVGWIILSQSRVGRKYYMHAVETIRPILFVHVYGAETYSSNPHYPEMADSASGCETDTR